MENASKALIIAGAILISILLITIGIVLINSGKDITSTGSSQMASQNIQTFNSQFTAYEGTVKGSQVRSLLSAVRASNVTDEAHQVVVTSEIDESDIVSTQQYLVQLYYYTSGSGIKGPSNFKTLIGSKIISEDGYVCQIIIQK